MYEYDEVEFNIKCVMRARWVPYFLGMLERMQMLGSIGSSRQITFLSDGDGDFRPVFDWASDLPEAKGGDELQNGDWFFDAG